MGMVFQNFALLPHLTVLDNVAFPLGIQGHGPADARNAGPRGDRTGRPRAAASTSIRASFPAASSSASASPAASPIKPEIWFLDEPFSALDPLIRREMQDELMRLQSVLHKTIVFITHDFDEAIRLADRIAIMKDGEIIQIGTPEELVVNPATDYVAEFTRDVQRAKVISARSLMRACDGDRAWRRGRAGRQDRQLRGRASSRPASPSRWSTAPASRSARSRRKP